MGEALRWEGLEGRHTDDNREPSARTERHAHAISGQSTHKVPAMPSEPRTSAMRFGSAVWQVGHSLALTTFELISVHDGLRSRWRRVGDHAIFKRS